MSTLTNTGEEHVVNWLSGNAAAAPVTPYNIRLCTTVGTETVAGTEVSGGSYPAGGKPCPMGAAILAGDGRFESGNTALVRFDNMPGVNVVSAELWDTGAVPRRWFYGPLEVARQLVAGDPVEVSPGAIKIRVD